MKADSAVIPTASPPPHDLNLYSATFATHPQLTRCTSTMADKLRGTRLLPTSVRLFTNICNPAQQQLESLQARFIGTGNADTTKFEWTSNVARDSLASYIGHPTMLEYMSIGLGQPRERTRIQLIERMIQPVGRPPEVSCCGEMGKLGGIC
jgi:splicing factor 3B subunit 5